MKTEPTIEERMAHVVGGGYRDVAAIQARAYAAERTAPLVEAMQDLLANPSERNYQKAARAALAAEEKERAR